MEKSVTVLSNPERLFNFNFTSPDGHLLDFALFRLSHFALEQIAPELISRYEDVFFYKSPDSSFKFIAFNQLDLSAAACIAGQGGSNFGQIRERISQSFPGGEIPAIPFFFTKRLFNNLPDDDLWQDFDSRCFIYRTVLVELAEEVLLLQEMADAEATMLLLNRILNISNSSETGSFPKSSIPRIDLYSGKDEWIRKVNTVKDSIRSGTVTKVVLTRFIESDSCIFPARTFLFNLEQNPNTHRFIYKRGASVFFGASPESLFTLRGNVLYTEALAGTRVRGRSPEEDINLEKSLRNDPKEIEEHKIVVDYIISALSRHSVGLNYNSTPDVKKLNRLQHLWTPVNASEVRTSALESVISDLFPTPAICGSPKEEAFNIIMDTEHYSRGLYSGLMGWYALNGDAGFFVPLRSALIKNGRIYLFCGGGIVKGSDPELEFEETVKKAESILNLII